MSAFESFVQLELPKRPYLETDVVQNSVIIRKGAGPRQLDSIVINQGEVLTVDAGGNLVSASVSAISGIKKYVHQYTSALTWTVAHNMASEDAIVQCFDNDRSVIIPDSIVITSANVITVNFTENQTGIVRVVFLS